MENNIYEWLISQLTEANERLDTIWECASTDEKCDSLDDSQFLITKCITVITKLKEDKK